MTDEVATPGVIGLLLLSSKAFRQEDDEGVEHVCVDSDLVLFCLFVSPRRISHRVVP